MCASYPAVPKELAVAAVTVLSFLLVGGGGGGGAMLGAAVLVLTLLPVVRLVLVRPVPLTAVAFTVRITERRERIQTGFSIHIHKNKMTFQYISLSHYI